jgi:hypothetical protein
MQGVKGNSAGLEEEISALKMGLYRQFWPITQGEQAAGTVAAG